MGILHGSVNFVTVIQSIERTCHCILADFEMFLNQV